MAGEERWSMYVDIGLILLSFVFIISLLACVTYVTKRYFRHLYHSHTDVSEDSDSESAGITAKHNNELCKEVQMSVVANRCEIGAAGQPKRTKRTSKSTLRTNSVGNKHQSKYIDEDFEDGDVIAGIAEINKCNLPLNPHDLPLNGKRRSSAGRQLRINGDLTASILFIDD